MPDEALFEARADDGGVGELGLDSPEAMRQAFTEPRSLAILRPDALGFIDHATRLSFLTDEVSMAGG